MLRETPRNRFRTLFAKAEMIEFGWPGAPSLRFVQRWVFSLERISDTILNRTPCLCWMAILSAAAVAGCPSLRFVQGWVLISFRLLLYLGVSPPRSERRLPH